MTLAPLDLNARSSAMPAFGSARGQFDVGSEDMDFEAASESLDRGIHVVSVRGEVDLATGPAFERALGALPEDGMASVIVDLTDCGFMDSTGLHLLTRTQQRFDSAGGRVAVVSANQGVLRVFGITGLDKVFAIYPSRAAALNGDAHH